MWRVLRRLIDWERRMGIPLNRFMVAVYEWLFVVVGPVAVGFGVFSLTRGFWAGLVVVALGTWMTWLGWTRLLRFARRLRRGD